MERKIDKQITRLLMIYILLCNSQDAIGRRQKRKFIFVRGRQSHWNDHVRYCHTTHSGRLLTVENVTVHHVLQKFVSEQWSANWGSDVWNGLYVSKIVGNEYFYQWQGTCTEPEYFNWGPGPKSSEKKCTKMVKSNLQWESAKCDNSKYSICEKYIGPCTYEDDPVLGSCSIDSDSAEHAGLNSLVSCQEMCSLENDCWAVNYKSGVCWLSYSRDPFYFDSGGSVYSSPCHDITLRDANLSWKRCFESDMDTTPIPTYSYSPPTEPIPLCNLLTQTTTQFYEEITTSLTEQSTTIPDDHMTSTELPSSTPGKSTTTTIPDDHMGSTGLPSSPPGNATTVVPDDHMTSTELPSSPLGRSTTTTVPDDHMGSTGLPSSPLENATTTVPDDHMTSTGLPSSPLGRSTTTTIPDDHMTSTGLPSSTSGKSTTTTKPDDHMTSTRLPSSPIGRSSQALDEQSTTTGLNTIKLSLPLSTVGNVASVNSLSTKISTHSNEFTDTSLPSSVSTNIVTMSENTTFTPAEEQDEFCLCECFANDSFDVSRYAENIIVNLKLNRKNMSNYKRKLISADDHRFSAKTIGLSLGVGVIVTVILAIILSDVCKVLKWLKWCAYDGVQEQKGNHTV